MQLKYGFISVDDHVQEPPNLWTDQLSKSRWGGRIPHLERASDGAERWVADGKLLLGGALAKAGALMPDRNVEPARWDEVPAAAYLPKERLKAMDGAGVAIQNCKAVFRHGYYPLLFSSFPGLLRLCRLSICRRTSP